MPTLDQLREQIDRLEGVERRRLRTAPVCDAIDKALPYNGLPLGCVHEIQSRELACAIGFAASIAGRIPGPGSILYVAPDRSLYPLGLLPYGVDLGSWLHVSAHHPGDLIWTVSEALRCSPIKAVLTVMKKTDLTLCRRLQLAAETSGTTGFLLGNAASHQAASAITRWRVTPVSIPGRGFDEPAWDLQLSYCRGGQPGKWMVAWRNGRLEPFHPIAKFPVRAVRQSAFLWAAKAG